MVSHFFKKTVVEGNVHVQLKIFDALIAYLRVADADAGRGGSRHCILVWRKYKRIYEINHTKNNK